jgi:hypothetical protein
VVYGICYSLRWKPVRNERKAFALQYLVSTGRSLSTLSLPRRFTQNFHLSGLDLQDL